MFLLLIPKVYSIFLWFLINGTSIRFNIRRIIANYEAISVQKHKKVV